MFFLTNIRHVFFGCSEGPSQWDGSFEYPQHMFFSPILSMCWGSSRGPSHWDGSFEYLQQMFFGWESKWRKWLSNARFYLEVLFFAPYLGFRLSSKSLETSHHGGQGLFEPRLSHLFDFRNFVPLDRSKQRTLCMLITCNLKIESYQFFNFFYPYKSLFYIWS